MASAYLLTGNPGTGKTTIIREALASFSGKAGGFYTEEIRENGIRQGFKLITIDGVEAVLSHSRIPGTYRVGKYGVDLNMMEAVAVAAIEKALKSNGLIVIDEIGKMELFSEKFKVAVINALNSNNPVLGTIMMKPHSFTDEIKRHPKVCLVTVTRLNRDKILDEAKAWLAVSLNENNSTTSGKS